MMLIDLIKRNRSYRCFDESKRISREELLEMVNAARLSSSARNLQPLRYRLVYKKEECDFVFSNLHFARSLQNWKGPQEGEHPAAYIILLLPKDAGNMQYIDTGIAAQSITLSAVEKGYGCCNLGSVEKEELHYYFMFPEDRDIALVIALGVPIDQVVLEESRNPEDIEYWRDENNVHHTPKLKLEDIVLPEVHR